MDLNPCSCGPSLHDVMTQISLVCMFAVPLGWILACFALWRPLPHLFAVLSRWFVGINVLISALILFALGSIDGAEGLPLGLLAASASGILAWIVVGRRSRALEPMPSLLFPGA